KLAAALENGQIDGLTIQDPVRMGYLATKYMIQHLGGQEVPGKMLTEPVVATRENMDQSGVARRLRPLGHVEEAAEPTTQPMEADPNE
ncbi:MAG: hypothetical protein ACOC93_03745, partial [Planctomycetota bacterium]